jgi:para-nitrobenzyl esterase
MVFVPGGGFVNGSGADPTYAGANLAAATGTLVVTINYRLGPFGFLSNAALRAEDTAHGSAGDYGILDQIAAFQWVHDNIAAFGGDPTNVTIFGQSSGGYSMLVHLASPPSAGLFSHVIVESAASRAIHVAQPQATADSEGAAVATTLGCTDPSTLMSCLRGQSVAALLGAVPPNTGVVAPETWAPVIDGYVIPTDPMQAISAGSFTKVPTLLGSTTNEFANGFSSTNAPTDDASYLAVAEALAPGHGAAVVSEYPVSSYGGSYVDAASAAIVDAWVVCNTRRVARAIAASGTPAFRYDFTQVISPTLGAPHGAELLFLFDNPFCWYGPCITLQSSEVPLSQAIQGYWASMASTGNPNGGGRFTWPPYDTTTEPDLVLNVTQSTETQYEKPQCDFWDAIEWSGIADGGADAAGE